MHPAGFRWTEVCVRALAVAVIGIWAELLLDPAINHLFISLAGAFGAALVVMGAAMGLGLLGFGIIGATARLTAWLIQAARWPDE
jgi:hypothetical protein